MEVAPATRKPGQGQRPVTLPVKIFRLVGSFACFGIMVNLFVCMARETFFAPEGVVPFVVLATLLALSVLVCREEFMESIRSRRFKVMLNGMLQGGIALVVLVLLLYVFGNRFYLRHDLSSARLNELAGESLKTIELLKDAPEPMEAVFLLGEDPAFNDPSREQVVGPNGYRARIEALLQEYQTQAVARANGRFRYNVVRMLEAPHTMQELGERMKLKTFTPDTQEGVIFLLGDRATLVTQSEMHGVGFAGNARRQPEFQAERVFTATMRGLLRPARKLVALATGAGEMGGRETAQLRELLARQNLDLKECNLDAGEPIPEGAAALVIHGPKHSLSAQAQERVKAFLEQDGCLLLFADAVLPQLPGFPAAACGLEKVLEPYGLKLRQDFVTRAFKPATVGAPVPAPQFAGLPNPKSGANLLATLRLQEQGVAFNLPCVVEVGPPAKSGYQPEALLISPPYQSRELYCWADPVATAEARTEAGADSIKGPVNLAAFSRIPIPEGKARTEKPGARILVVCGSSTATDKYLTSAPGNAFFTLAALRWIAREDELVSEIPPRDPQVRVAKIEEGSGRVLLVLLVLGLPAGVVFAGLIVWTIRRN